MKKRGLGKNNADYTLADSYKYFVSRVVNSEKLDGDSINIIELYKLNKTKYHNIIKEFNMMIMEKLIMEAATYKLPGQLGELRIQKRRNLKLKLDENSKLITRKLPVDWKATKELWEINLKAKEQKKLVFITNDHFDGHRCIFTWHKKRSDCPFKSVYQFIPSRHNKRWLASVIKDPNIHVDYFM
jgi:hypothetical protein